MHKMAKPAAKNEIIAAKKIQKFTATANRPPPLIMSLNSDGGPWD